METEKDQWFWGAERRCMVGGGSTGHFYSSGTILYDTDGHRLYVSQNAQNVGNREP